jgi:membrane-bound lytic murein transglycosylase D
MARSPWRLAARSALLPIIAILTASCGPGIRARSIDAVPSSPLAKTASTPARSASAQTPSTQAPVGDPVEVLIATADKHFKTGQTELERGHLEAAKLEFNRAVDVLLESSYGARGEPRIREYFDRLVDRVSAYEIKALAEGDGFTEKRYEPASIDELLAVSMTYTRPAPTAELQNAVASDARMAGHDVPIPLNQRVLSYIELFQGRLHDFIADGLERGSKYLPMIQGVFRAEGLPLDLAYVPLIESAFKPNALSRANAKGVWQFMSGTARENGLRRDWYVDERSDPEKATVAAARYLKQLNELFSGDWHLALASYNGGPGRLQRALKQMGGSGDFWKLSAKPRLLPRETREYVPMILAAIVIARNPAQYGFAASSSEPAAYDRVKLPCAVDLRRIAEWSDTTIDEIQALNPELRRWTTPIRDTEYEVKVPAGSAERVVTHLEESAGTELASLKWYTVARGETLLSVARKLRVSRADLAEANYMKVTAALSPGQQLMVPNEATALMAARTDRQIPVAESRPVENAPVQLARAAATSDAVKTFYEVRAGDTLSSIARLFRTSVASLKSWNKISSERIMPGQRLAVFVAASTRRAY